MHNFYALQNDLPSINPNSFEKNLMELERDIGQVIEKI